MASPTDLDPEADQPERSRFEGTVRQSFVTGVTLTVPAVVTLVVLVFAVGSRVERTAAAELAVRRDDG